MMTAQKKIILITFGVLALLAVVFVLLGLWKAAMASLVSAAGLGYTRPVRTALEREVLLQELRRTADAEAKLRREAALKLHADTEAADKDIAQLVKRREEIDDEIERIDRELGLW